MYQAPLWAQHESAFWDDPHIAKQVMAAHLHPDWDSASRPHSVISRSVDWLVDRVLSDNQRDGLLTRIHKALKAGGSFAFDVQTTTHKPVPEGTQSWSIAESGFWSPTQHMVLSQNYIYTGTDVDLEQVVVVEQDGSAKVYRLWMHSYAEAQT